MGDIGRIYIIKNTVNDKVYIGKTIQSLKDRWDNHLDLRYSNCTKLKNAMIELGKENFYIEILEDNIPYSLLDTKEISYITSYNSVENGYNIKYGNSKFKGRNFHKISDDTKERIKEDYLNGISPYDIASHFKLGLTSIYNILSEYSIPKRYNKGGFNSKAKIDLEKLIELKQQGYGTSFISDYFNVAKSSVKRYIRRHKNIIFPRVSNTLTGNAEGEDVLWTSMMVKY